MTASTRGGKVKQVLCWAHARREFFEPRSAQPEPVHTALTYIGKLYALQRLSSDSEAVVSDLLPDVWLTSRPEARRCRSRLLHSRTAYAKMEVMKPLRRFHHKRGLIP